MEKINEQYRHYLSWIERKQDAMYVIGLLVKKFNLTLQDLVDEIKEIE